ncbi:MAG: response regulator transcription factor [Bacteriovoracaceae bacterium]
MFRILIVDDTKSVHSFVKHILSRNRNIKTESVFNGSEALVLLKKDSAFDAILLDWEMPLINGPETLQALKRHDIPIPVVMMTTKNAITDIQTAMALGASEYIMKPFTEDILFEKLSLVTGKELINAA